MDGWMERIYTWPILGSTVLFWFLVRENASESHFVAVANDHLRRLPLKLEISAAAGKTEPVIIYKKTNRPTAHGRGTGEGERRASQHECQGLLYPRASNLTKALGERLLQLL